MDEERTTLSDEEILTTGMGETRRAEVMDADGDEDADGDDDADVDTDDSDSDADTDDAS